VILDVFKFVFTIVTTVAATMVVLTILCSQPKDFPLLAETVQLVFPQAEAVERAKCVIFWPGESK
jgi:hypothetical protein